MLSALRCHQLDFSYTGDAPIFDGLDLHLPRGWTGLVGPNGAGKTTLLRLLIGELSPTSGRVEPVGEPDPVCVLCAQRVEVPGDHVLELALGSDGEAWRWMGLLDLTPPMLDRWSTLSAGERKRWQVGAALWRRPDALILDEPTNHLDIVARGRLTDALDRYTGIGLLVSHDRELLDRLTTATVRVDPAEPMGASLYRGNYATARQTWEAGAAEQRALREQLKAERVRLGRQLTAKRNARASAESQISTSARAKGLRDADARTTAAKGRVQKAEAKLSRRVRVLEHKVDKAAQALADVRIRKDVGRSLSACHGDSPKSVLAVAERAELQAGERVLARDVNLAIHRSEKLAIWGPNGVGKTTLVAALRDGLRIPLERLIDLPQHLPSTDAERLLVETRRLPPEELGHVMEIVAALGVSPNQLLASQAPSPGEARKLMLAHGLGRATWLLLLDEPTNHLDLPSVERLEVMLGNYPGAIVLVSHDRRFAGAVCDEVLRFKGGSVVRSAWSPVNFSGQPG